MEALGEGWKCARLVKAREEGTVIKSSIPAGRRDRQIPRSLGRHVGCSTSSLRTGVSSCLGSLQALGSLPLSH